MTTETFIVTWGDNHKKAFTNHTEAYNFAHEKAFYFSDTKLDGEIISRKV